MMLRAPLSSRFASPLLVYAVSLAACSSGSSGNSGTFSVPNPTSGPTTDPESSGEGSGSSSDASDTTGIDDTTTGEVDPATTAPGDSPAQLVWTIDNAIVDYGNVPVDASTTTIIELENVGDHPATSLVTGTIPGDFSFPGGYPGTDGTCGEMLAPQAKCRLDLRFGPTQVGPVESSLSLEYYDGVDLSAPTMTEALTLRGAGQGESENLLINGDAETGELAPWTVPAGSANWELSETAFGGTYAFTPTGAILVTSLAQTADVSAWQDPTAVPGVQFRVRARVRSLTGHTYRLYVSFGNSEQSVGNGTQATWNLLEHTGALPVDATSATVRLECANDEFGAAPCDVLFDDVALQMVYP